MTTASDIVGFWRDSGPERWFSGGDAFDGECRTRFLEAHLLAARREFEHWLADAEGALALVLLLDQIPRNVFRCSGHAFATDGLARHYASRALTLGFDAQVDLNLRSFFYLPFEHSEDMADQERALELFSRLPAGGDRWARLHYDIIRRFGRFPHRNAALGRETTSEERAFLAEGGFRG
ncbi:uncharacterized protein (DUF924 family) [Lysobacter niabensis]|uniref:Uncharacterized protein (DUF924 family) n=1 Tax=Agrilutibacter niabensis TaxID=380628 RepID=A0ABU1VSV3_9GAMM|nr:DUF924 family protein [Lysobacter niabensis]MDR7100440.1 uncharacterized protein (DUF924 family) [Lysobacter niabensis]